MHPSYFRNSTTPSASQCLATFARPGAVFLLSDIHPIHPFIHPSIHAIIRTCFFPVFLHTFPPSFIHLSFNPFPVFQPRPFIRPWIHSSDILLGDSQTCRMVGFGIVADRPRHGPRHKTSGNWVAVKVLRKRNVIKYKQVRRQKPPTPNPQP